MATCELRGESDLCKYPPSSNAKDRRGGPPAANLAPSQRRAMATMGLAPTGVGYEDPNAENNSDDSEMEVWDESEVAAVESSIRESQRAQESSVTQWGNAYFRPGTAPEVREPCHPTPSPASRCRACTNHSPRASGHEMPQPGPQG